jgi:hypothetical protein
MRNAYSSDNGTQSSAFFGSNDRVLLSGCFFVIGQEVRTPLSFCENATAHVERKTIVPDTDMISQQRNELVFQGNRNPRCKAQNIQFGIV